MRSEPSQMYHRLVDSALSPLTRRDQLDSLDPVALAALEGPDKARAEDFLLERLRVDDDYRIPRALVRLSSDKAIAPLIEVCHSRRSDLLRVEAAQALLQLGGITEGEPLLMGMLREGTPAVRTNAAKALQYASSPASEEALYQTLLDEDRTVSGNAYDALLSRHGVRQLARSYHDVLGMLRVRLGSPLQQVRLQAVADLHRILEALRAGQSAEDLGLVESIDEEAEWARRVEDSLLEREGHFHDDLDLEALTALSGAQREWAVHMLMSRLSTDPRVPRALAAMDERAASEPLREALRGATGEMAVELARALWRLAHDVAARDRLTSMSQQGDPAVRHRAQEALHEP